MLRSHCFAILKQPCLIIAKKGNDQREYIKRLFLQALSDMWIEILWTNIMNWKKK